MFRQSVIIGALLAVGIALAAARPQQDADDTWLSAEDADLSANDDLLLSLEVDLGTEDVEDALPEPDSPEDETLLYPVAVEEQQQEPQAESSSASSSEESEAPRARPAPSRSSSSSESSSEEIQARRGGRPKHGRRP
ncbi:uncharacterized protein LOC113212610 [Frankliniella occidentalis]|uniref:Uncharacterized protein LOC113212610 n=1 Tax=Frankliniella occidentalis TaxID=133901 RepID=A0A6J1T2J2_FRAOC|nr:uncharacterized protein LOC113212610 [Frankliniella occidentalis]